MRIDRLKILRDHLLTVPLHKFNMDSWKCGTVMCAFGHGTTIPAFRADGLFMLEQTNMPAFIEPEGLLAGFLRTGLNAAEAFFGLNHTYSRWLFIESCYLSPDRLSVTIQDVVKRLDHLIVTNDGRASA